MKAFPYIYFLFSIALFSCKKTIDLYPQSNLNAGTYYSNSTEMRTALTGVYSGLTRPLVVEWQLTELRSDNSKQGVPASTNVFNRDLSDLDMFTPAPDQVNIYNYWLNTYNNIYNTNVLLQKLGVVYNPGSGAISFNSINASISENERKQVAGEALFIRAHHYFNLVRLFGGVFLVHEPISPGQAKVMNRASVADIYKLIEADLTTAAASMNSLKYNQIPSVDLGRATTWAAKALLGKVYLTQGKKAEAITVLNDVKNNSGHSLVTSPGAAGSAYANVFATSNEMNAEIIFAVRYKAGGLGNQFAGLFAPLNSGSAIVNGSSNGYNYPTNDIDTVTNGDNRKSTILGTYGSGATAALYPKKFVTTGSQSNDAENDWPVIRFADVLLLLAEAQGYTQASLDLINQVRTRAGMPAYNMSDITSLAQFEEALSTERRIELAFENQRWFDLVRFNTTMTTITAEETMKAHFTREYYNHYRLYVAPAPTLAQLHANVTREKLLLPIPQREIDTNTQTRIEQNPGY